MWIDKKESWIRFGKAELLKSLLKVFKIGFLISHSFKVKVSKLNLTTKFNTESKRFNRSSKFFVIKIISFHWCHKELKADNMKAEIKSKSKISLYSNSLSCIMLDKNNIGFETVSIAVTSNTNERKNLNKQWCHCEVKVSLVNIHLQ